MTERERLLSNKKFQGIAGLFRWSSNYDFPTPLTYFLDMIGYSRENYGMNMADWNKVSKVFGYLELDYLAKALTDYALKGEEAYEYVCELLEAEQKEEIRVGRW